MYLEVSGARLCGTSYTGTRPQLPVVLLVCSSIKRSSWPWQEAWELPKTPMIDIAVGLEALGLTQPQVAKVMEHVHVSLMPHEGVHARLAQLQFGVQRGLLTETQAAELVVSQPEALRREFGVCSIQPGLVSAIKPYDSLLTPDKSGPRWPGDVSLRDWLAGEHPETTMEYSNEVRLCHNLDFATSGSECSRMIMPPP